MKPKLDIIAVGAGGGASYLFPALNNSFDLSGVLMDADILEEHNLDRQIFDKKYIGKGKAESLIKQCKLNLTAIDQYLENESIYRFPKDTWNTDVVICMVDNHPARRACIKLAEHLDCAVVITANEYSTSQSIFWHPDLGIKAHPLTRYPEMVNSMSGSPINCTGEALESTPQLAIANQMSAALGNFLLYNWMTDGEIEIEDYKPIEFQSTFSKMETITVGDL